MDFDISMLYVRSIETIIDSGWSFWTTLVNANEIPTKFPTCNPIIGLPEKLSMMKEEQN